VKSPNAKERKMKKNTQNANVEMTALNADELAGVQGGAGAFLRGNLAASQTQVSLSTAQVGRIGGYTTSGTTLCDWPNCTRYISSC
jgi:hypothetical protein